MMTESQYLANVATTYMRIEDALESVDPTDVEVDSTGDVLSLTCADGTRVIINTQRPTRQIWLAAKASAWHFSYNEQSATWLDDKGRGFELFSTVCSLLKEHAQITVVI